MSRRMHQRTWISLIVIALLMTLLPVQEIHSFSGQTLRVGSRGNDVTELQGRLTFLGYHRGAIDGIFGWQTYNSVRSFQSAFGMKVDGIVGPQTRERLLRATVSWAPQAQAGRAAASPMVSTSHFSQRDLDILAQCVYGEARGEPYIGQVAVAAVVLNRIRSSLFPNTVSGVIFQPRAFTAVDDGQIWLTPNDSARRAVRDAINGWDPSGGALYYFNPVTATSAWIWTRPQIKQIGKHIFCR